MTEAEHKSDCELTKDTPSRASYGMYFVSILEGMDRVITSPHCIYVVSSMALGQSYNLTIASEVILNDIRKILVGRELRVVNIVSVVIFEKKNTQLPC